MLYPGNLDLNLLQFIQASESIHKHDESQMTSGGVASSHFEVLHYSMRDRSLEAGLGSGHAGPQTTAE